MQEQYQKQIACIKQLLEIFEAPTYNEVDPETNKKIMDIMSEVCSFSFDLLSPIKGYHIMCIPCGDMAFYHMYINPFTHVASNAWITPR